MKTSEDLVKIFPYLPHWPYVVRAETNYIYVVYKLFMRYVVFADKVMYIFN